MSKRALIYATINLVSSGARPVQKAALDEGEKYPFSYANESESSHTNKDQAFAEQVLNESLLNDLPTKGWWQV